MCMYIIHIFMYDIYVYIYNISIDAYEYICHIHIYQLAK